AMGTTGSRGLLNVVLRTMSIGGAFLVGVDVAECLDVAGGVGVAEVGGADSGEVGGVAGVVAVAGGGGEPGAGDPPGGVLVGGVHGVLRRGVLHALRAHLAQDER